MYIAIQFYDHGRRSESATVYGYRAALRATVRGILGSSGDTADLFLGDRLVAIATQQYLRRKFSVRITGEKPAPIETDALPAARKSTR